jgi:hypothetical protein
MSSPMPILGATWNICGGVTEKLTTILDVSTERKFEFLVVTECRFPENTRATERVVSSSGQVYTVCALAHVCVFLRGDHFLNLNWSGGPSGRTIRVRIRDGDEPVDIVGVYAPPAVDSNISTREIVYNEIRDHLAISKNPMLFGDFNARCGFASEVVDSHPENLGKFCWGGLNGNSDTLLQLLVEMNLCIPSTFSRRSWAQTWTWFHKSSRRRFQCDLVLAPCHLRKFVCKVKAVFGASFISDHRIVICSFMRPLSRRLRPTQPDKRTHLLVNAVQLAALQSHLAQKPLVSDGLDATTCYMRGTEALRKLADELPQDSIGPVNPWHSEEYRRLRQEHSLLLRQSSVLRSTHARRQTARGLLKRISRL